MVFRPKKPDPFKRPSIDLDKSVREWREVPASDISVGDTIPGVGLIKDVKTLTFDTPEHNVLYLFIGVEGNELEQMSDDVLLAFVKKDI